MITIIPAIDIIDGKCVRLSKGDYATAKVYNHDPMEAAKQFEDAGLKRLHLVDLDGAKSGSVQNWNVLEKIASRTTLQVDFSGGISSGEDVKNALENGAAFVSIGSMAVKNKELFLQWIETFGPGKFLLGADVKNEQVVVRGWTETTTMNVYELIGAYLSQGIDAIFCTDVSKDGMLEGPSVVLYRNILEQYPGLNLIASGGVSCAADIDQLDQEGLSGVIIGKAFYEGTIKMEELKKYVD